MLAIYSCVMWWYHPERSLRDTGRTHLSNKNNDGWIFWQKIPVGFHLLFSIVELHSFEVFHSDGQNLWQMMKRCLLTASHHLLVHIDFKTFQVLRAQNRTWCSWLLEPELEHGHSCVSLFIEKLYKNYVLKRLLEHKTNKGSRWYAWINWSWKVTYPENMQNEKILSLCEFLLRR